MQKLRISSGNTREDVQADALAASITQLYRQHLAGTAARTAAGGDPVADQVAKQIVAAYRGQA